MDPIFGGIVSAIAAGAALAAKKVAGAGIEDAYALVKGLIVKKLGTPKVVVAVEQEPSSEIAVQRLADQLVKAQAGDDKELMEAVLKLQEMVMIGPRSYQSCWNRN
jgi:hypothetical protein